MTDRVLSRRTLSTAVAAGVASAVVAGAVSSPLIVAKAKAAQTNDISALTIFVGGLDTRQPGEPENSDVLILARVDTNTSSVRAVSIPRDLYVEIPNFGYDKITRAYDYGSKADNGSFEGGAGAIRDTISNNFGVEIDGVVLTTFEGFAQVVDAFGGVDVDNPYDLYDGEYPTTDYGYKEVYFPAGPNHLSGDEALEFSRTRHQDGDDGRVMRQQLVLRALLDRAHDPEIAPDLETLVHHNKKAVRTDLTSDEQLELILAAPDVSNDNVVFTTLANYIYPDSASNGMWIYSGDWSQIPGYVEGFLSGDINP